MPGSAEVVLPVEDDEVVDIHALELDCRADTPEPGPDDQHLEVLRTHATTIYAVPLVPAIDGALAGLGFPRCLATVCAVLGEQRRVVVFEFKDAADAGEVDSGGDQSADPSEAGYVVGAVAAGATVAANGGEQTVALVEPQRLHWNTGKFGGDRDPVHAVAASRLAVSIRSIVGQSHPWLRLQEIFLAHLRLDFSRAI